MTEGGTQCRDVTDLSRAELPCVAGIDAGRILQVVNDIPATGGMPDRGAVLRDGKSAQRIRDIILAWMRESGICSGSHVAGDAG